MSNNKGYNDPEEVAPGSCGEDCQIFSRVCGYYRPINNWNHGKKEEFRERKTFELRNVTKYFDPQMGVEYTTADIVTGN